MALSEENILTALLDRATNPNAENVDELAVQIFCVTVRDGNGPNYIRDVAALLLSKIKSPDVTQSIRALSLLDECMTKCGSSFRNEISRFTFLNEIIRLVSTKHEGDKTSPKIRNKIMDCLLLWTTEYPDKVKIREAYDLLRKQGVEHTPSVTNQIKKDNIMGIDEEKFRKLLQSGNAEDLKRANLLIQSRVNQDARRMELMCRHKNELQEIQNTSELLSGMLDSYEQNMSDEEEDTFCTMNDLYESCQNYLPIIKHLPELIDNTNEDLVEETLETNGRLLAIIERYKKFLSKEKPPKSASRLPIEPSTSINTSDLLSSLLVQPDPIKPSPSKPVESSNPLDELNEIFGKCNDSTSKIHSSIFENIDLLEPTTLPVVTEANNLEKNNENTSTSPKYDVRKLEVIDIISEELLKQNLQHSERRITFKKEPEKLSLNEMAKEKTITNSIKPLAAKATKTTENVESVLLNTSPTRVQTMIENDNQLDTNGSIDDSLEDELILGDSQPEKTDQCLIKEVVHLADIQIDLDELCPTTEKLLLDDDIKITLNFTSNRPSPNVSVIVVSVTNQSKLPVTSFQFDASVRKPSKVRLLPATGDSLPGKKPFRPPTPINLVMLILNPTKAAVDVTCIVGYKLGDDPDPIKESIVAKDIAYVE